MRTGKIKHQRFRFIASGMVTLFLIAVVMSALMMMSTSNEHLLWGIPVIAVSLLDIYFLTRSLLSGPKSIDTRLSTFMISIGTTFGFSLVAVLMIDAQIQEPYLQVVKQVGRFLSLIPYPFVIWALFCLKDCLTVVPEAHKVVAYGIYKYSRHPLYVCYFVWAIANIMMFPYVPMVIASTMQIVFLVVRLRREEKLLLAALPEYGGYYRETGLCGPLWKGKIQSIT